MRLVTFVDVYIAVSPYIKERYVEAGFPERRFEIVPNFFEFTDSAAQKIRTLPVVQLLYAGRLTREKGTDLLINAVKDIPLDVPWRLQIVGEGPLKEECVRMVRDYKLESHVVFTAWVDQKQLPEIYATADIFIHPSRIPESFGRTFVEAMSHGLPIIASNIGAAPWTVRGGVFFENGNASKLRDAIRALLEDGLLRKRLGEEGVRQSSMFSKAIVGPRLEQVLKSMTGKDHFTAVK